MIEKNQINQEITDKEVSDFFSNGNTELEPISNLEEERNSLFQGGFDDIDVWIKHEEFRLKIEEF